MRETRCRVQVNGHAFNLVRPRGPTYISSDDLESEVEHGSTTSRRILLYYYIGNMTSMLLYIIIINYIHWEKTDISLCRIAI